ncbi:MAG: copper resistance protein CopC [Candidatus Paceibacterota bacterium]
MRFLSRFFAISLLSAFCGLFSIQTAFSHAEMIGSKPVANSQINAEISEITLVFNEVVKSGSKQFSVTNQDGVNIEFAFKEEVSNSGQSEITLTPKDILSNGSYLVSYSVISEDGHLVSESFSFSSDGSALVKTRDIGALFATLLEYFSWLLIIFSGVLLLSGYRVICFYLSVTSALLNLISLTAVLQRSNLSALEAFSNVGELWSTLALMLSALALSVASVIGKYSGSNKSFITLSYCLFVAQGLFSGHHLLVSGVVKGLALISHLTHLAAGAAWLGALIYLALDVSKERLVITSKVSTISVYTLLPSSIILSLSLFDFKLNDIWGYTLLVKVFFVFLALFFGYIHHTRVRKLQVVRKRSLLIEISFFIFIFAAASTLGSNVPGKFKSSYLTTEQLTTGDAMSLRDEVELDNGAYLEFSIDGVVGSLSTIMFDAYQNDGSLLTLDSLSIELTNSSGVKTAVALSGAGSHYMGNYTFPANDIYDVSVVAVVDGFTVLNGASSVKI